MTSFRRTNSDANFSLIGEKERMWGQLTPFSEIAVHRNPGLPKEGRNPLSDGPGESEEQK